MIQADDSASPGRVDEAAHRVTQCISMELYAVKSRDRPSFRIPSICSIQSSLSRGIHCLYGMLYRRRTVAFSQGTEHIGLSSPVKALDYNSVASHWICEGVGMWRR